MDIIYITSILINGGIAGAITGAIVSEIINKYNERRRENKELYLPLFYELKGNHKKLQDKGYGPFRDKWNLIKDRIEPCDLRDNLEKYYELFGWYYTKVKNGVDDTEKFNKKYAELSNLSKKLIEDLTKQIKKLY